MNCFYFAVNGTQDLANFLPTCFIVLFNDTNFDMYKQLFYYFVTVLSQATLADYTMCK